MNVATQPRTLNVKALTSTRQKNFRWFLTAHIAVVLLVVLYPLLLMRRGWLGFWARATKPEPVKAISSLGLSKQAHPPRDQPPGCPVYNAATRRTLWVGQRVSVTPWHTK